MSIGGGGALGGDHVQKDLVATPEGLGEPFFLQADDPEDEIAVLGQLPVDRLKAGDHLFDDFAEEGAGESQATTVADGTADDAAQDVATPLVAGNDTVADEEGGSAGVLGDDPQGEVGVGVGAVLAAGQAAGPGDDGSKQVGLVDVVLALENDRRAFEAHAGVDAGGWQGSAVALGVLVELHEHEVPHLDEALAIAVGVAAGDFLGGSAIAFIAQQAGEHVHLDHAAIVAALLGPAVVVDFRAGASGALRPGRPPPVVLVAVPVYAIDRDADLMVPDVEGFVVVEVNGDIEPVGRKAKSWVTSSQAKATAPSLK